MVDASRQDPEQNVIECAAIVNRANEKGISIEAEMGRIKGSEDGLPNVEGGLESLLTDPDVAQNFIKHTGVQFLAPSFGNTHVNYGSRGAEGTWRLPL